jgi:hypothetical protein
MNPIEVNDNRAVNTDKFLFALMSHSLARIQNLRRISETELLTLPTPKAITDQTGQAQTRRSASA